MNLGNLTINLRNHPTLAWFVDYWPSVVFVLTILLVISAVALVTHWWDRRDESIPSRQRGMLRHQRLVRAMRHGR